MLVINEVNVNRAYQAGMNAAILWPRQESRNGPVRLCPTPVMTVYNKPMQRVLFDPVRDANPFFHLFESLWMLAGRDDPEYLNQFVGDFGSRYAEPDTGKLWGAYGHRWIHSFKDAGNQLDTVVDRLSKNHTDRRSVIQMWDPELDLYASDEAVQPRDVPCNTQVYPLVRSTPSGPVLDITVTCRSNDLIWGAYGANAVHFSVLQEYLAARIGVGVGKYYQLSNNMHVYEVVFERFMGRMQKAPYDNQSGMYSLSSTPAVSIPMFSGYTGSIDEDIKRFLDNPADKDIVNPWYKNIAQPMMLAHQQFKTGDLEGAILTISEKMQVSDWRLAAASWFNRRLLRRESRSE